MQDQRNLILAVAITLALLFGFDLYMGSQLEPLPTQEQQTVDASGAPLPAAGPVNSDGSIPAPTNLPAPAGVTPGLDSPAALGPLRARETVIAEDARIAINSPRVQGSIRLKGGRLDDLVLHDYKQTLEENSPDVVLLSPSGTANPYFAEYGWTSAIVPDAQRPGPTTLWQADGDELTPETPVTLTWDNGAGLVFKRTISLDDNYMLAVTQSVTNNTGAPVSIQPYGIINRTNTPVTSGFFILHEGPIGVFDGTLEEVDYSDLVEEPVKSYPSTGGWLGITDKYWLMALIPGPTSTTSAQFRYDVKNGRERYQANAVTAIADIPRNETISIESHLFAGAKESHLIDAYGEDLQITNFDRAIDWGWFYWLTRPIFWLLDQFNSVIGNFGVAILLLTVLIKLMFFSLANKSYVAMGKMRKLQPKMTKMREQHKDDPVKQREAMMKLYQDEKVNPVSGCLPILIQIPVFFALYKVLFVSIEMRHAPFFGWVQDLSAPDPLLITTLFGLIPWDPPSFLAIGIWPLIMGITMWGQQKLNPAPPDPIQAKIFMFLPILFTFLLASFPVGLVIYWTWNNLLTISQQWVIMKRHGAFD